MRLISFEELCSLLESCKDKEVMLTFHSIGDRDAVGSAVALSEYLQKAVVRTPDFLTNNAKRMLEFAGYSKSISPEFAECGMVIVLDANNVGVMSKFRERLSNFAGTLLFIDHHVSQTKENGATGSVIAFNDESFNSTASIVYAALKQLRVKVGRMPAILLLNGIIADSADLQNSNADTFRQMAELLEVAKIRYSDLTEYYHSSIPAENRFVTVSDIQGARAEVIGRYVLVYGQSTAHANVDADNALNIGADAAVFWAMTEREGTISARLRPPLDKTLGIHLGEMMKGVADDLHGNGGGHACAAGAYGPERRNAEQAGLRIVEQVKQAFRSKQ